MSFFSALFLIESGVPCQIVAPTQTLADVAVPLELKTFHLAGFSLLANSLQFALFPPDGTVGHATHSE